jgi:hypothetical protein
MKFVYNDGGRHDAGYKGNSRDCVCRSIAIVTEKTYQEIYDAINHYCKIEKLTKKKPKRSNARNGVFRRTYDKYLKSLGYVWIPTMGIGTGCKIHLNSDELPKGRLIVRLSKHLTAVINGVIHDTFDCSRKETRCVYGYYIKDIVNSI